EVTIDGVVDGETVEPETVMTIEYDCSDVLSGISECHGSVPSGSQLDTSTPGTYPVTVVGVDRAGNERRIELHYTVLGDDTVAPTLEVDAPEEPASGWFTTPVTLRFSAADTGSGVAGIFWEYSDGADVVTGSSADDEAQLTLDGTAEYAVEVWAEDADGNRSEPQHLTLRLDADAPVIQLHSPVPPEVAILPNGHYAQHERVVVDFECTDLGSGIERCDAT